MTLQVCMVLLWYLCLVDSYSITTDEHRLHHYIMKERKYLKLIRPPGGNPNNALTVKLGLKLSQILSVSEKNQIVTTKVWLHHEWFDSRLRWDPQAFGNLTYTNIPSVDLWRPDIVLYNNADGDFVITLLIKAKVYHTGLVVWEPPAIYKSYCPINVEFFPFDQQECHMKFSCWTYDGYAIDLQHVHEQAKGKNYSADLTMIPMGIDLCHFTANVEWDIINVTATKRVKYYPCCNEPYPDITFNVTIRRKTLFYTINLILPIIAISTVTVLVFYLPSNSGEKITLSISILLALTVFFLLLSDISPPTSIVIPLIGKYLLFTMIMVTMSIFLTVYTLSIHFRSPATHEMSDWVRRIFTELLPRFLMMTRPKQDNQIAVDVMTDTLQEVQRIRQTLEKMPSVESNSYENHASVQPRSDSLRHRAAANQESRPRCDSIVKRSLEEIAYIAENLKKKDSDEKEERDWNYVAMVMDRLFLYIFTAACICGTIGIFLNAPSLHDPRTPLSNADFDCAKK